LRDLAKLRAAVTVAFERMNTALTAWENTPESSPSTVVRHLEGEYNSARDAHGTAVQAVERAEQLEEARAALPVDPGAVGDTSAGGLNAFGSLRVTGEEQTYHLGSPNSFMLDQLKAQKGDVAAIERIVRSTKELVGAGRMKAADAEERVIAETAGAGGELVAPIYLQDEYLKVARAARPYFDALSKRPLPPNTNSINIPRLKTGTATATQKDLGAVKSQDLTTGLLTFPVITIAGQQDFARQLFDRSIPELADMVVFPDLVGDYLTKTDIQSISGNGVAPNAKGVLETVEAGNKVAMASVGVKELYKKLADAIQRIHTKRFLPPQVIVMHPRRWAFLLSSLDANERPLIVPSTSGGAFNTIGALENVASEAIVGSMHGLPVIVDSSIPTNLGAGTNQDVVIVQRVTDSWVLEDNPVKTKVYEEVLSGELAIRAQVFNYLAITHERYAEGIATVEGAGLVTPTF
jgi:HK97 family phage major capsid protein